MTTDGRETDTVVVVHEDHEADPIGHIIEHLERLGIPVEVVGRGRQLRRSPVVVFRVSRHQVAEAILALELQGFRDVLAYHTDSEEGDPRRLADRAAGGEESGREGGEGRR